MSELYVSLVSTYLATLVLESALFGLLVLLFGCTVYLIVHRLAGAPGEQAKRYFLSFPFLCALGLVIVASVHWALSLDRASIAFIGMGSLETEVTFYADLRRADAIAGDVLYFLSVILTDALVVYRLWIISSRRWAIVVLPVATTLGSIVACMAILVSVDGCDWNNPNRAPCHPRIVTAGIAAYGLSLMTNFYSMGMIAYRIRAISRAATSLLGTSRLRRFFVVFIESAALQTVWLLADVVAIWISSYAEFLFLDTFPAVAATSATLIHARTALGWRGHRSDNKTPLQTI